jgi:CheY-like chemotaxis protein
MEKDKTIIIAEDDTGHCLLMTRNLRRAGITNEIITFTDGRELLDFLFLRSETLVRDPQIPYILLLDVRMPRVGGIEVLRQIKGDAQLRTLPVIVISTTDDPAVVMECYRHGCSFYIAKPVDHTEFVDVLGKLAKFIAQPSVKFSVMHPLPHQQKL